MLDIETLGKIPGSVIVAIGAVKFQDGEILSEFYERIDLQSCIDCGLKMDASTVMWWLKQAEEPRMEITKPGKPLPMVLRMFSEWMADRESQVWGNGVGFDNALLSAAYTATGIYQPWKYSGDRCYRTLKNLFPAVEMKREGVHHNALDDAKDQAVHLMQILQIMFDTDS